MGELWEGSRTKARFDREEAERRKWVSGLIHRFGSTSPEGATNTAQEATP